MIFTQQHLEQNALSHRPHDQELSVIHMIRNQSVVLISIALIGLALIAPPVLAQEQTNAGSDAPLTSTVHNETGQNTLSDDTASRPPTSKIVNSTFILPPGIQHNAEPSPQERQQWRQHMAAQHVKALNTQ